MRIIEQTPELVGSLLLRDMVEPILRSQEEELVIWRGYWPARAVCKSTVVLESADLIALHIRAWPGHSLPELWRYYVRRDGEQWQRRNWNQLSMPERRRVMAAYTENAPAWAAFPGNMPGEKTRKAKRGPTYLLARQEVYGLVKADAPQTCRQPIYRLGKRLSFHQSCDDKEVLLLTWQRQNQASQPAHLMIVECEVQGEAQRSGHLVRAEWLCPVRVIEPEYPPLTAETKSCKSALQANRGVSKNSDMHQRT